MNLASLIIPGSEGFTPSPLQQAIFQALEQTTENLAVLAVAGSGKTTTAVYGFQRKILTRTNYPSIFLAFNKRIAEELQSRGVSASTFHALAYKSFPGKKPRIDTWKLSNIMKKVCRLDEEEQQIIKRLVPLLKNAAITLNSSDEEFWQVAEHFDIECSSHIIKCCERVLKACLEDLSSIDFDDMVWVPYCKKWDLGKYSFICVDETQDTNKLQRELLRQIGGSPRFLFIGDPAQSIYGFRGADSDAFHLLIEEFNCKSLPLDVSYRCPQAIVEEAHEFHTHIRPSSTASKGSVSEAKYQDVSWPQFLGRAAIICRNTKPLISFAYRLIRDGIPAVLIGKDLGASLIRTVKRFSKAAPTIEMLVADLIAARDNEVAALEAAEKYAQAGSVQDRYDTLLEIIEKSAVSSLNDLCKEIERLFSPPSEAAISLATIHRSKGLEWPVVFWLDRHLLPSKWARQDWERSQENNLGYVAVTRAKEALIYIDSEF
jgi:superfamily I DNA/RNA helicase